MRLLLALAILFVALGLGLWRWSPPAPADGGPDTFSSFRARRVQEAITKPGPRPIGSPNAAAARDFLVERLKIDGYDAHVERDFVCGRHGSCGFVENVVGRRGARDRGAVLLAAHYDSVPAAPGASDDGVGVAAVSEAARALGLSDRGRPILVLFADGEEAGLLGAEAFARSHMGEVFAVINCDARGTTGASMMFETNGETGFLISQFAAGTPRPITSSLFYEVYKRMPNDTDFTVLRSLGRGINLANLNGVTRYHTPLDSLENADPGTLQQHGDAILGTARAFAMAGDVVPAGEIGWFDVLGFFVVRWPARYTPIIAAVALALLLGQAFRKRAFGVGLFAGLASFVGAGIASYGAGQLLLFAGAAPVGWIAHPLPALISLHFTSLSAGLAVAFFGFRKTREEVRWAGVWITWAAFGLVASRIAPGASYLLVVPALSAGLAGFLPPGPAAIVPAAVAAVLWMPLSQTLYEAIGFFVPASTSLAVTVLVTTLVPLVHEAKRRWNLVPVTVAALAGLGATLVPPFSAEAPQRADVIFHQDGDRAEVAVSAAWGPVAWGAPPREMVKLLSNAHAARIVPWGGTVMVGDAPHADLAAPIAKVASAVTENGHRHVRATLVSPRHADTLILELPQSRAIRIEAHGKTAVRRGDLLFVRAVPVEGLDVELDAQGGDPIPLVLHDATHAVPPAAAALVQARPSTAAPSQEGDITVLTAHLSL